jgi:hypothetical protein
MPTTPPVEVMKGSFEAFKSRKRGLGEIRLPLKAISAGKHVAPRPDWLTGVQFRLNALGFGSGPMDGIMGPRTEQATKRFQRSRPPLVVDGIPGPNTQGALVTACGY